MLVDPVNIALLNIFVNDERNLRVVMNLLCSPYSTIQYLAFNIFKVFKMSV